MENRNEFETQSMRFQPSDREPELIKIWSKVLRDAPVELHPEEVPLPAKVQIGKLVFTVSEGGMNRADKPIVMLTSECGNPYSIEKRVFLYHLLIGRYKEVE